jgi:putative oxidoreductase
MKGVQMFLAAIGRMGLSLIFILSAIHKILNWQGTEQAITSALNQWALWAQGVDWIQNMIQVFAPKAFFLVVVASIVELVGGLLVFFGIKVRLGAGLLFLFLIPATLLFHSFWYMQGADRDLQMAMFLKNLAIAGGLLVVLGLGCGSDKKETSAKQAGE